MSVNEWRGTDNWGDEFDIVDIPVGKPQVTWTIEVLTDYPSADREDTAELVEILRETDLVHFSLEQNADRHRRYGRCVECGKWWPCPTFESARYAATEWLVRATNAIMRRNNLIGPPLPVGGKPPEPEMEMLECYWCGGDCLHENAPHLEVLPELHRVLQSEPIVPSVENVAVVDVHVSSNGHKGDGLGREDRR